MKSLCVRLTFFNNECYCYILIIANYGNYIAVNKPKGKVKGLTKILITLPTLPNILLSGTIEVNRNIKRERIA